MTLRLCFYNDCLVCERLNRHLNIKVGELQMARKDAASHQTKLHQVEGCMNETKEHCRRSEEALQQTEIKLHLEQQRCEEYKNKLQQTEVELQKARKLIATTQSKLWQVEESLKVKEEHCHRFKETLRQNKEKKRMKEEKAQHTKGKLYNLIRIRQKERHRRTEQKCKQREDELQLFAVSCCLILGAIFWLFFHQPTE